MAKKPAAVKRPNQQPKRASAPQRSRSQSQQTGLISTAETIGRALGQTTAAIANRLQWGGKPDGLDLLERDHRRIEQLLAQGVETNARSVAQRTALLKSIARELILHEEIEEKVLYPALKSHAEAKEIVLEGYQEHHVADIVLQELQQLPPSDERWGAKLKVLKENIEHHIEEEEGEMFSTARSVLSRDELENLGRRMQALKQIAPGTAARRARSRTPAKAAKGTRRRSA
jgi:hemerythrin superfamily protein